MNNLYFSHIIPNFIGADRMEQLPIRKGSLIAFPHLFCINQDNILKQGKMKRLSFEELPEINSERWKSIEPLDGEEWRDVKGYEGIYMVSNVGRVKRNNGTVVYKNGKIYKTKEHILHLRNALGYYYVGLCQDNKPVKHKVHRLVALAFIPNPDGLKYINHKNENKKDNTVDNLEWCTILYNNVYGTRLSRLSNTKKKKVNIYKIDGTFVCSANGYDEASIITHTNRASISNVCHKILGSCNGFVFRHENDIEGNKIENVVCNSKANNGLKKAILQCDLNGNVLNEFPSMSKAAKSINKSHSEIFVGCKTGKPKFGFIWKYKPIDRKEDDIC